MSETQREEEEEKRKQLALAFEQTLSSDPRNRQIAEEFVKELCQRDFGCLELLKCAKDLANFEQVRLSAAVLFKNEVKKRWNSDLSSKGKEEDFEEDDLFEALSRAISEQEKIEIRKHVLESALDESNQRKIKMQLSESVEIIAEYDLRISEEFPMGRWPELLPMLVACVGSDVRDSGRVGGCLRVANQVFKRFRGATKTERLYRELKIALDVFAKPLLEVTKEYVNKVLQNSQNDVAVCKEACKVLRLCARIFYSLNSQELPEVFEDDINQRMELFHGMLNFEFDGVDFDALRAAICDALHLYAEKNEEEFKPFLETFVRDIWTLLGKYSQGGKDNNNKNDNNNNNGEEDVERQRERVASTGMAFLTVVASGVHHKLFEAPETLQNIIENIAIPNLQFRADDEEIFTDNFAEYLRRDMEGGDQETRRRAACELIKALAEKFPESSTAAIGGYVQQLLGQYSQNPSVFWKAKDCAIYLVLALAVKKKTNARGATEVNKLVDVSDFFNSHIKPELCENAAMSHPVIRADCLKFLTVFRGFVPREAELAMLPFITKLLLDSSNVVHSYAANCLEKMMTCRDFSLLQHTNARQQNGAINNIGGECGAKSLTAAAPLKFTGNDFAPFANEILQNCFNGFELDDSSENEFIAKLVAKTLRFVGSFSTSQGSAKLIANEVIFVCCESLCKRLDEAAINPRNPTYNHFLFEATTACVQCVDFSPSSTEKQRIENAVFPSFMGILARDNAEFTPYVFQILALMLESSSGIQTLSEAYLQLLPALLAPQTWDRQANIPALVRLLDAYLKAAPAQIAQLGYLTGVLGVFQKLVSSKAHDHQGFYILNAFAKSLELSVWGAHLATIWQVLFQRLQTSKTPKFCRGFVVFLSVLVAKRGPEAATTSMATIQPGIHEMILQNIFSIESAKVAKEEKKLVAVAGARFLCETDLLNSNRQCWQTLFCSTARAVDAFVSTTEIEPSSAGAITASSETFTPSSAEDDIDAADELLEKIEAQGGYSASYSQLSSMKSSKRDLDVLPEIKDVDVFFAQILAQFAQQRQQQNAFLLREILSASDADVQSCVARCFTKIGFSL